MYTLNEAEVGILKKGSYADLIVIDGNPLDELDIITDTNNMFSTPEFSKVMKSKGAQPIIGLQLAINFKTGINPKALQKDFPQKFSGNDFSKHRYRLPCSFNVSDQRVRNHAVRWDTDFPEQALILPDRNFEDISRTNIICTFSSVSISVCND